jgi:outer membrane protein assembly factor BamA
MFHAALLIVSLGVAAAWPAAAGQTPGAFTLAGVEVVGARRYSREDVTRVAGLTVGQAITVEALAAAAERLGGSGLFATLTYRYVTKASQMTATFEFEEAEWIVPVIFDNFVWFTADEVTAAVRNDVPSFDGTAPRSEGIPDLIGRSLQKLLEGRQLPGRVQFMPQTDLGRDTLQYVFAVKEPAPRVCAVRVAGASAIPEQELVQAAALVGSEYSKFHTGNVSDGTLRDMYRNRAYWAAVFGPHAVAVDAGCSGVTVALQVSEGAQYGWDRAQWSGNTAMASGDLDALLGLKSGQKAEQSRIADGQRAVHRAYARQGYIGQSSAYVPRLDDSTHTAVFEFRVVEGPQFRFGALEFAGFAEGSIVELRKHWRLQPGAVYDDSYPQTFMDQEVRPRLQRAGIPAERVNLQTAVDAEKKLVSVKLVAR